jgi:hypothetical protein
MMPDQALPLGTRLGGCTVEAVLAADECGFVYRMTDSLLLGRVAIKEYFPRALAERNGTEVRPRSAADEAAFAAGLLAFAEEARLLTRLQHPGLMRVLDSFEAHETVYQVMPLIDGQTLEQARRQHDEPPDVAWLRELMLALLEPVEALHAAGLVHGDIHPAKVMLRATGGRPLLMGFGAVRRALHAAPDTTYAPLEQTPVGGHLPRGAWTDLYALGAVTWFAATGNAPPASSERSTGALFLPAAAMQAALEGVAGDARDRAQLIAAVDRALALLPPDRPQSAAELRALFTAPAPVAEAAPAMVASREEAQWRTLPQTAIAADLAPPRLGGRRRVTVGAWAAALLLCSAAGALTWRWNEVMQASRSLAAAARSTVAPPVRVAAVEPTAAPVPVPMPVPVPAEPAALPPDLDRVPPTAGPAPESAAPAAEPAAAPATPPAAEPPAAPATPPAAAPAAAPAAPPAAAPPKRVARDSVRRPAKPPSPPRAAPRIVAAAVAPAVAPPPAVSPRGACGARENFSLYYCMQTQCRKPQFSAHAQCRHLRETGEVG